MNDYIATINFRLGEEYHTLEVPCKGFFYGQATDNAIANFKASGVKFHEFWVRGMRLTKSRC